jgi:hypothetical protein
MTFTPCGECPLDRPCDEETARRRAGRGACAAFLDTEEPVRYCASETYPATLESPAEACENEAAEGSDLCYWHDPDGAAADHAESVWEDRRERGWT